MYLWRVLLTQTHAYPADELMPLSCRGRVRGREINRGDIDDALGDFSLTLVDTLDSLAVSCACVKRGKLNGMFVTPKCLN